MHLRAATDADAEVVARLHAESWRDTYHPALSAAYLASAVVDDRRETWTRRLADPPVGQQVLLACDGDAVLGFACTCVGVDPTWGSLLDNLHVRRDARDRGLGALLLRAAAAGAAAAAPEAGLFLWVLQVNVAAQRFYLRHGATARDDALWAAPDGSRVPVHRFAWPAGRLPR